MTAKRELIDTGADKRAWQQGRPGTKVPMTPRTGAEREAERERRADEARQAREDHARAAQEEDAKTQRLRTARLAHEAEEEIRRKRAGKSRS